MRNLSARSLLDINSLDEHQRYLSLMKISLCSALVGSLAMWSMMSQAAAQAAPQTPPTTAPAPVVRQPMPVPWPIQMGLRSFQVEARIPVVDKVVLVPDTATYLDEISRWTLRGRWPILIEDDLFTPMFVRAFKPSKVIRRASVGAMPASVDEQQALAKYAITQAWTVPGSEARPTNPAEAFASARFEPLGIVFASMSDPAWTAGVALAAGHGQVLSWLDGPFDPPSSTMNPQQFEKLSAQIEDAARATGLRYAALGDSIDAVTICRSMPIKVEVPQSAQWAPPAGTNPKPGEPVAVTDALCRLSDGTRWAIASTIFGDQIRSAYIAMSSLYLMPRSVWMLNTYQTDGDWGRYAMTEGGAMLKQQEFETTEFSGVQASAVSWLNMLMGGFKADVLLMNTMGNSDFFNMWQNIQCYPEDVAMLQHPMALHLIHSWSLTSPESRDTVGGRWLEHGVYAYAGSVFEPFLAAFVPPSLVAQRVANLVPFLVASRWSEGPFDATWRVTLIGDPLMVIPPPSMPPQPRLAPSSLESAKGETDVKENARAALVAAKTTGAPAEYATALLDLVMTGDDAMAAQLWSIAVAKGDAVAVACAPSALGPLFRQRQSDAFLAAYRLIPAPTLLDQDMLWQLWTQQLASIKDRAVLDWFGQQVRTVRPAVDLSRLAPEIKRVAGTDAARVLVTAWLEKTTNAEARKHIRELLLGLQ